MGTGTDASNAVKGQEYDLSGTTGRRGQPTHHNGGRNSREIQHNIEITRAELDETVTAIQQKLSLEQWTKQAFDIMRDNARHGAPKVLDTMRANPMPTALMAFGLGWLIMRATGTGPSRLEHRYVKGAYPTVWHEGEEFPPEGSPEGYLGEDIGGKLEGTMEGIKGKASEMAGSIKDKTQQFAGQAQEKAGQWASQAWDKTGQAASQVGEMTTRQLHRAGDSANRTYREYPLAIGALCLAVGAAVGLGVPRTHTEDELMGETRDEMMKQAIDTGRETAQKVGHVVEQAQQTAVEEAKKEDLI